MKKPWHLLIALSVSMGLALGAWVMWMAWQHNPQCEIHCAELGIDWAYWLTLGGCAGLLGFSGGMLLACMVRWLMKKS